MNSDAVLAGAATLAVTLAVAMAIGPRLRRPLVTVRRVAPAPLVRWPRWAAAAFGGALVFAAAGATALLVVAAVAVTTRWWRLRRTRLQRAKAIGDAYPDAIDLVVLAIRAGLLPPAALEAAGEHVPAVVRPAFAEVGRRSAGGERFADALTALTDALGDTARPMVDSLAAAERYGLPLAPVLERLAGEARADRRRTAEAVARQLPVRLAAPLVVCTLPSFVLLAIVPLLVGAFSSWHVP